MNLVEQVQRIETLGAQRAQAMRAYRAAVEDLRRTAVASDAHAELYRAALAQLGVEELTLHDVVMVARNHRWPLDHGDSFFRKMVERRRKKQLGSVPEKHLGLNKAVDLDFARQVGILVPRTLWTGRLQDIPEEMRSKTFLKPTRSSGAKGAFYLFGSSDIFSVYDSSRLSSWDALEEACRRQMRPGGVDQTTWEVQELVEEAEGQPARDLKFFSFYGDIGLIQEVSRHPFKQYEFFDADGSLADCGRDRSYQPPFLEASDTITDKGGVSKAKLETARRMSLEIPAPFMRIDFLNGGDDLVFCEFSASPGMSHTFNREYDRILGAYYNRAEIRLVNDLLAGKSFDAFSAWSGLRGNLARA